MSKQKPVETLYAELIRRGLPAEYARRTAGELDDHRDDLINDLRRQQADNPESVAAERLGETRALADRIARDYRRRSWFGRHPVATFVVAPIPVFVLAVSLFALSMTFGADPLFGDALQAWFQGLSGWSRLIAAGLFCLLTYSMVFVAIPAAIALCLNLLAVRTTVNPRWAIAASLLLAVTAGAMDYHMRLSLDANQSSFSLNSVPITANPVSVLRHYAKPAPLAQFAMPMVMLAWVYASERRRRRQALLAVAPIETLERAAA